MKSAKASNAALVKIADWIIKNDHVINSAMFFCKWFKHGQTSNAIWLSTAWPHLEQLLKQFVLQSCFFLALPRHTIIMTDKGFNRFDECAARCVHLFHRKKSAPLLPEGQEQHSKLTEDANWNKRKWYYSQNKDLGQKWYCQTLKIFRIISSEMKISFLILSWWCFSCLIFRE